MSFKKSLGKKFSLDHYEEMPTVHVPLPVLALKDVVIFPNTIMPLFIGRQKSVLAVERAMSNEERVFIVAQKDPEVEDFTKEDIYKVGVVAKITNYLKLPDGTIKIVVDAVYRAESTSFFECKNGVVTAKTSPLLDSDCLTYKDNSPKREFLVRKVKDTLAEYIKYNHKVTADMIESIAKIENCGIFLDLLSSYVAMSVLQKQRVLENTSWQERLEEVYSVILSEISAAQFDRKLQDDVRNQIEKSQKDYYLNEQIKAIRKELGDDGADNLEKYETILASLNMSQETKDKIKDEIKKLKQSHSSSSEGAIIRSYLDFTFSLPWGKTSSLNEDIKKAQEVLDGSHFGLQKQKDDILEYLSVQIKTKENKGNIICLYGPPGVGKTSLVKSIAQSCGRNFVKISLGGVRDEAEVRGHRRTYIGALPGKIIAGIKKAGVDNPVILLDEIDKISSDYKGDPASALLEVLDPEQNKIFTDHYLDLEYDLSKVMFIATANSLNMPLPLLDRMYLIKLNSYLEHEKLEIARKYIMPKVVKDCGLKDEEIFISDEAILNIIRLYTRESGVRDLERMLAKICRKVVRKTLENACARFSITELDLKDYLGVAKFEHGKKLRENSVAVATGLAYTEVGGDILNIEAVRTAGKGGVKATGKLGTVMQESVQTAFSYICSKAAKFGITLEELSKYDVHVHVPEGATPKDGPSAGIAIALTISSLLTNIAIRSNIAMTGEITLRGKVLPIGGLREKLTAAIRSGIGTVIIPKENEKDLEELPDFIAKSLKIFMVEHIDEVLEIAMVSKIPDFSGLGLPKKEDMPYAKESTRETAEGIARCSS